MKRGSRWKGLVRRVVERVRESVDVVDLQPALPQAIPDGAGGEVPAVLLMVEALFGAGGDDLSIDHQAGRGVLA